MILLFVLKHFFLCPPLKIRRHAEKLTSLLQNTRGVLRYPPQNRLPKKYIYTPPD